MYCRKPQPTTAKLSSWSYSGKEFLGVRPLLVVCIARVWTFFLHRTRKNFLSQVFLVVCWYDTGCWYMNVRIDGVFVVLFPFYLVKLLFSRKAFLLVLRIIFFVLWGGGGVVTVLTFFLFFSLVLFILCLLFYLFFCSLICSILSFHLFVNFPRFCLFCLIFKATHDFDY